MKRHLLFFIFFILSISIFSQKDRKVVVMDMTAINSETNLSRLNSVINLMKSTGLPFEITSSIDSAILYPIIITASRLENGKLNSTQVTLLENYVSNGGILINSSMRDSALFNLCGISGFISEDTLYSITWNPSTHPSLFSQINDSLELIVSLGDSTNGPTFFTRGYNLNGAISLGEYENGYPALIENNFGSGKVYSFGPDFRDIYLRNQLDFDANAHRTYSNGFEPTTDVFMFLVRNIIHEHIPNSVYKYTSLGKSSTSVLITHDIDSESALDTMELFSDFEKQRDIVGQYNITTRYFNDGWMTSFYVGSVSEINTLLNDGHKISSHSVGHFPDFADGNIFPFGSLGNDATNYQPFYTGGITTDGSLLGELEVSKNLLEDDHGVNIRSFRAGHLAFHDSLINGLELLGYEFNSTQSSNNILTGFPFYNYLEKSFSSSSSSVLEIPLTISDVFGSNPISSSNYMQKVSIWLEATRKYEENNSPVCLLIHPNRHYKLDAQQAYLDSLSEDISIVNFEDYGDFWRKRDSLEFHTVKQNDSLLVFMDNSLYHSQQSFVVDTFGIDTVLIYDENLQPMEFDFKSFSSTQRLYYPHITTDDLDEIEVLEPFLSLFPNPSNNLLNLIYDSDLTGAEVSIFDVNGKIIHGFRLVNPTFQSVSLNSILKNSGLYFIVVDHLSNHLSRSFIYSGK